MKIGILSHLRFPIVEPFAGGLEAHTSEMAASFAERGHEVLLAAREGSAVETAGVEVLPVLEAGAEWRTLSGAAAEAQEDRFDEATALGCRLLAEAGCDAIANNSLSPAPYELLGDLPMLTLLHTPATLRRVGAVISDPAWSPPPWHSWASVSAANAVGWRELLPEVEVIPNGIDLPRWPARLGSRPEGRIRAIWSGRLTPEKGPHLAIEAALLAGCDLDLYGPAHETRYIADRIEPLLGDRIRYLGHANHRELARAVRAADVQLVSSLWPEPFGLVALEAMACGTPVATLPAGAVPELVDAEGGRVASASTAAALAAVIPLAAALPREAVRRRAERFSAAAAVEAYLAELHRLADLRASSPCSAAAEAV